MSLYLSNSWQVGTSSSETFYGDRYGVARNDVFQLGGSETGTLGGIRNGWEKFLGGEGEDRIYVAPKYYYVWTAIMIADNGLNSVERIEFSSSTSWPVKPVYFSGTVDFSSVTFMSPGVTIYGREYDNTFIGGQLGETVEGDAGNDTLYGNGGNDRLFGDSTSANPWVAQLNAAGNDKLYGGDGNDYLNGQRGNDLLYGDAGNDELYGEAGNDQLYGGSGSDRLLGGEGDDQLRGGVGNDNLYGDAGKDLLDGGEGVDYLWGGAGEDTFQFRTQGATSFIEDFEVGIDRLRFDNNIADEFSDLTIVENANGYATISVGDVAVVLTGVSAAALDSSMFEFGLYA
jgi:Ca2+-binding RTX toxin-like protein